MTVPFAAPVIRQVALIELPSTNAAMIWACFIVVSLFMINIYHALLDLSSIKVILNKKSMLIPSSMLLQLTLIALSDILPL